MSKPRYQIKIERFAPVWDEERKIHKEWHEYITMEASSFRLDEPRDGMGHVPQRYFRVYPAVDANDFEGDSCILASFDICLPHVNTIWLPHIEILGHVRTIAACTSINPDGEGGSPQYSPNDDREWMPGLTRIWIKDMTV